MTKTAEAAELAKRLMEFLDEVKAGHEVLVTRGETPVARLVPVHASPGRQRRSVLHLAPLSGQWVGETVLKSGDLADEIFARE
jgi:prevent-host-death family protein